MFAVQSALFQIARSGDVQTISKVSDNSPRGQLGEVIRQPLFIVAVMGAMTGFGLMTLVMTATPLSMHINEQYSSASRQRTSFVSTYLACTCRRWLPGFLIERLGVVKADVCRCIGITGISGDWAAGSFDHALLVGSVAARCRLEFLSMSAEQQC